jgi:HEAT repeat protein
LPRLQREIRDAHAEGRLDDEAQDLALAVARRELRSADGDAAVERVRELRSCVGPLEDDFEARAEDDDDAAAAALLALLETGRAEAPELFERYSKASAPMWRSVGARAALSSEQFATRRAYFLDGDLRVRRAALHAAVAKPSPADVPSLLEAARLDPDPLARSVAVRALGEVGNADVVSGLHDLWQTADAETRQAIVDAWATPPSSRNGGLQRLLWVMETEPGLPRVVAASRLLRSSEHASQAAATLERSLLHGPVEEQRLAVLLTPTGHDSLLEALVRVSRSTDLQAAVLAAAALLREPKSLPDARLRLLELSRSGQLRVASQAKAALSVTGEQSIAPGLLKELKSPSREVRRQAAFNLLALGRPADAALALGDESASVRTQVACAFLRVR